MLTGQSLATDDMRANIPATKVSNEDQAADQGVIEPEKYQDVTFRRHDYSSRGESKGLHERDERAFVVVR